MMKSNEEFIAGIYEKAATYTEEKETKIVKVNWVAKATRIAAMAAVCIGLAGIGSMVLGNGSKVPSEVPQPGSENYGIALSSEVGEHVGGETQFRIGPAAEVVTFTGVVTCIDEAEKRIWMSLVFDETAPEYVAGSVVCIRWDMLEDINEEVSVGETLTATGSLSRYENETSKHHGCAELVLTDLENLEIK